VLRCDSCGAHACGGKDEVRNVDIDLEHSKESSVILCDETETETGTGEWGCLPEETLFMQSYSFGHARDTV